MFIFDYKILYKINNLKKFKKIIVLNEILIK